MTEPLGRPPPPLSVRGPVPAIEGTLPPSRKSIEQFCPELSKVAQQLLCVPPSSATSERVYSCVARVWCDLRSRLTHERVQKLLYIYFNRRALKRDGAAADDWEEFEEWLCNVL